MTIRKKVWRTLFVAGLFCLLEWAPLDADAAEVHDSLLRESIQDVASRDAPSAHAAVLDFRGHSLTSRFHVIERSSMQIVKSFVVAHGLGSEGKRDDGYAEVFSNVNGSLASSLGLYRARETYFSKKDGHGLSLRLDGLSSSNSNARRRFVVIHANWYMEPKAMRKVGRPGRSNGCMVFSASDRDEVIRLLKDGAFILAIYSRP